MDVGRGAVAGPAQQDARVAAPELTLLPSPSPGTSSGPSATVTLTDEPSATVTEPSASTQPVRQGRKRLKTTPLALLALLGVAAVTVPLRLQLRDRMRNRP